MNQNAPIEYPIVGFAVSSRRVGYFVEAGNRFVFEYGVKDFTLRDVEAALEKACAIVDQYQAKTVCLQDIRESNCKLGETSKSIVQALEFEIQKRHICLKLVGKPKIWKSLKLAEQTPKKQVAVIVAKRYPEISHLLPAPRKLWDDEPRYMCMYMAAAMTEVQYDG